MVVSIAAEIADGLAYIHESGAMHLDLCESFRLKFAIAKSTASAASLSQPLHAANPRMCSCFGTEKRTAPASQTLVSSNHA